MITAHRTRKPQKAQAGGPHATNIPAQAQHPPQHLPASEIRVPYQSSAPPGQEVVQCRRFWTWLREKLCCGDGDIEIAEPTRVDGPCAVAALKGLGWYTAGDENRLKIQTAEFGELGRVLNDAAALSTLDRAMILFFHSDNSVPFHVMYTDGEGNLCGENNDPVMLMAKFGLTVDGFELGKKPLVKIPIQHMVWNPYDGVTLKYITFEEYQMRYDWQHQREEQENGRF